MDRFATPFGGRTPFAPAWGATALPDPFARATSWAQDANGSPFAPQWSWSDWIGGDPFAQTSSWSQWADDPIFGYTQRPSQLYGLTYDPIPGGQGFDPVSNTTSRQVDADINAWLMREYPELMTFPGQVTGANPGQMASPGGEWANIDSWNNEIQKAIAQVQRELGIYVPGNVVKSVMRIESGGSMPNSANYAGAHGLMQVTPSSMGGSHYDFARMARDPGYSIYAGVYELALRYQDAQRVNPAYDWSNVAVGYFSGHYEPTGASDAYNSDFNYKAMFDRYVGELNALGGTWQGTASVTAVVGSVLAEAQKYVGVRYQWGAVPGRGDDPRATGWDCSGFTYWLDQNYGTGTLPAGSHYQYQYAVDNGLLFRDTGQLKAGDVVFFDTGGRQGGGANLNAASHVGIYLGGGKLMHAANESVGTIISDFSQYARQFIGAMHMGWSAGANNNQAVRTRQFSAIWGGFDAPITQEFGPTEWSMGAGAWMYDYAAGVGVQGHPGLDVGVVAGTRLFSPGSGTVTIAGGSGYYKDDRYGNSPATGELRIRLTNGHELILGHMGSIALKVGDPVSAGTFVGVSGTANGDHVHVEYRIPGNTSTGWQAVDPRRYLGGMFAGSYGESPGVGGNPYVAGASDWSAFMRAAATGGILPGPGEGAGYSSVGGFHDWLRQTMGVGAASTLPFWEPEGPPSAWLTAPTPIARRNSTGTTTGPTASV